MRYADVFHFPVVFFLELYSHVAASTCFQQDPFGDTQRTDDFASSCYVMNRKADHPVHPYFLRKAYGLGERIANVTVAWKNSSYVRWG
jgi:hypothetical protein